MITKFSRSLPTIIFDPSSSTYEINYKGKIIRTVATNNPSIITKWVEAIISLYGKEPATVGFNINWQQHHKLLSLKKKKKPATLQFYIGGNCLIIQLCHVGVIPEALKRFLINPNFTFAAVKAGIKMAKLKAAHGLQCSRVTVVHLHSQSQGFLGLFGTSNKLSLVTKIKKPKHVRRSSWEVKILSEDQVLYASLDAYASLRNAEPDMFRLFFNL